MYNITVYTKKTVQDGYTKEVLDYDTKETALIGWHEIDRKLTGAMKNKSIVNFQLEANFQIY